MITLTGHILAFCLIVATFAQELDEVLPNSATNIHLNKVTNGQWHQWIASDTSRETKCQ